jgi:signal transduction histidine kinase
LWQIEVVLSRSLRYASLTIAVVAVYVACVGLLGGVLGRSTGAPIIATALVAVGVEPMHRRSRTLINRLVYGEPDDPFAVLARAGQRLESARDATGIADEVLPEVVASVAAALRLPYVAVILADGTTVGHGAPGKPLAHTPLAYGGQEVGRLVYAPRPGGVSPADRRLLEDLARHAAVAAHTVILTRDLARSREQLITAREDERRRLYRDLHDGLGPALAALALQVETARDLSQADPVAAHALLERAAPRLKSTVDEVRTIVRGLRPPALDDLGLVRGATRTGGRVRQSRLPCCRRSR